MTLALLLTAATGAWATTDPNSVSWDNQTWKGWAENVTTHTVGDITITCSGNAKAYESTDSNEPLALQAGASDAITFTSNGKPFASVAIQTDDVLNVAGWTYNSSTWSYEWSGEPTTSVTLSGCDIKADVITFTFGTDPITVEPGSSANTWTFKMPGSDVVLTPIYANAAAFATTGTEPEATTLLPAAAEGVIAGTDASLIAEGTGIVANIGETTTAQGTLMYAIGTSATQAPALTAFSATAPTAENVDDAATVYVWYYIQGANAPEGEAATLDNTFNDTEPVCLTVQVLTNKFDITLNAANANTIEAGKATVTVGGEAATVTEGKLQGVKMGSEVKLEAKPGYKFRKVEAKKGAAAKPLANATTEDLGKVIGADGNIYDTKAAAEAANTNAVAMICYVVEGHGLALALTDEVDKMNWSTAQTTCDAHTPAITGGKWMLASKGEWNNMISAAGSYTALRDGFSSVSGTNMQSEGYWSSTEDDSSDAWNYYFSNGLWSDVSKNWNRCVRACLAF